MLRIAIFFNAILSVSAIGFAIFTQQMSGAMIRHSHFQFFETVPDDDRRRIFTQAAAVMWIAIVPLLVSNIAWIAIGCATVMRKPDVKPQVPSSQ